MMIGRIAPIVLAAVMVAGPTAAVAEIDRPGAPPAAIIATSEQSIAIAGKPFRYTAEVGIVPVASKPGQWDATAGYISYTHAEGPRNSGARKSGARPILFVFNGGPGAASAYLQMGALGPMRAEVPQDTAAPIPAEAKVGINSDTLLDSADLVFIDPPGTGFSTLMPGANRAFYQSVKGDADAVAELARQWLVAHHRTSAPLYILGESYGTIRAAAMVDALHARDPALKLRGVMLLGQALNMIETSQRPGNVMTYPIALPTLAAIACYHHVRTTPCDPAASAREAAAFEPTYLNALFAGRALAPAARDAIAGRLEQLTGISRAYYLSHDLRISKEQFRVELLRSAGKVLGRYDARYTASRPENAGGTVGADAFSPVSELYGKAVIGQLAQIGVRDAARYKVLTRFEGDWSYGAGGSPFNDWPFMAQLEKAMSVNPALRLFVGTGLYDLTTTVGAADYLFAQSSLAPDRFRNERYPAGHVAYSDNASWRKLIADLRSFMQPDTVH